MIPVYSYPTLFGDIDLEVLSVTVDGADLPYNKISKVERTVALDQSGRTGWQVATLQVRASIPNEEIAGGPWRDLTCLSILAEKATNMRSTVRLDGAGDSRWCGAIDLIRANHLHRATLSLGVVATVGDVAGRLIGSTRQDWYVDLRSSKPVRQRAIEIEQVDFVEGPHEWLRPFKGAAWIVDTTGDIPTVYLNTRGVEGLIDLLNGGRGGAPAERLLREVAASQIAQDAWIAMFHTAIADLDSDEDGTPLLPTGWRGAVLRMMLPDVLPGRQVNDALFEVNERRTKGLGWSGLQTSIHYAAGRRSQINRKLTNAVRTALRGEGGDTR
ncbi:MULTISPECIES: hypothetical protein [unclassified Kribbella]|uniref:hypothetical protein n=1 Tax=unclassified Kribbella TaxID=2644121 RepID=UPI0030194C46